MINTLNDVIEKISNNIPFAFSRWGDGEFKTILKNKGKNCDGNFYYPEMGDELLKIVSEPRDYYMGVQTLIPWSFEQGNKYPQKWSDSDVFHKASIEGTFEKLIELLFDVHVVYIGNETLSGLTFIDEFIEIPYNNVWNIREEVMNKIKSTFDENKHKVYCFSAGMCANVFIHDLWQINKKNSYIDIGSVFDPYVGINSRLYHKELNKEKLILKKG